MQRHCKRLASLDYFPRIMVRGGQRDEKAIIHHRKAGVRRDCAHWNGFTVRPLAARTQSFAEEERDHLRIFKVELEPVTYLLGSMPKSQHGV